MHAYKQKNVNFKSKKHRTLTFRCLSFHLILVLKPYFIILSNNNKNNKQLVIILHILKIQT